MRIKLLATSLVLLSVAACSNSPLRPPQTEYLKDGTKGWKVTCEGATLTNCYKKAKIRCPKGFDVVAEDQIAGSQIELLNDERHLLLFKCR